MRCRVGRWAVQCDRAGLVVLDLVEWRRRHPRPARGVRIPGDLVGIGGPFGPGGSGSLAELAAAPRRDEPAGFGLLHLQEAYERGRRGRPLR